MSEKDFFEVPVCECHHNHPETVKNALSLMPEDKKIACLGDFFKVFGEPSRLKILYLLYGGELCVCDIAESLGSTVSAVSHQLKILKNARLVNFRKDGKNCFYSLADNHISGILSLGTEHINE